MLFTFELVSTVTIADGDRQRIDPRLTNKFHSFLRMSIATALGVAAAFFAIVVLSPHEHTEFAFDHAVVGMSVIDHLAAEFDIFFKRIVRSIDHH